MRLSEGTLVEKLEPVVAENLSMNIEMRQYQKPFQHFLEHEGSDVTKKRWSLKQGDYTIIKMPGIKNLMEVIIFSYEELRVLIFELKKAMVVHGVFGLQVSKTLKKIKVSPTESQTKKQRFQLKS